MTSTIVALLALPKTWNGYRDNIRNKPFANLLLKHVYWLIYDCLCIDYSFWCRCQYCIYWLDIPVGVLWDCPLEQSNWWSESIHWFFLDEWIWISSFRGKVSHSIYPHILAVSGDACQIAADPANMLHSIPNIVK